MRHTQHMRKIFSISLTLLGITAIVAAEGLRLSPEKNGDTYKQTLREVRPSTLTSSMFPVMDCDSLEDALRTPEDTFNILNCFGLPGDTVDIPFYVKNDSVLAGFQSIYIFDTSMLEPIIFPDTIIKCVSGQCDTTIDNYIWTWRGPRAIAATLTVLGVYEFEYPRFARVIATPIGIEIDSVQPGGDVLCYQRFLVKSGVHPGDVAAFEFTTSPVWSIDTTMIPWDSTFEGCVMTEFAEMWEDFPELVVPEHVAGLFRAASSDVGFACGDASADGSFNIGDVTFLLGSIFGSGPDPSPMHGVGDINCDNKINIADVTYSIAAIFIGGPPPCCPPGIQP